jgi:hypothetical protein
MTPKRCATRAGLSSLLYLLLALAAAGVSAQPRHTMHVGLYLHCFSGVPAGERQRLDYWSTDLARGNPDPDCVSRQPLLPPLVLQRVDLHMDYGSATQVVRLEVEPARRSAIEAALKANLRNVIAITVQNRIVGTLFVTDSSPDHRIAIRIADKKVAADLLSDLSILLGVPP